LFFDQAFLPGFEWALSTFLLAWEAGRKTAVQPVDKSVVKLWKDSARRRRYWRGAIVSMTG
jgi:hypothetical protein